MNCFVYVWIQSVALVMNHSYGEGGVLFAISGYKDEYLRNKYKNQLTSPSSAALLAAPASATAASVE